MPSCTHWGYFFFTFTALAVSGHADAQTRGPNGANRAADPQDATLVDSEPLSTQELTNISNERKKEKNAGNVDKATSPAPEIKPAAPLEGSEPGTPPTRSKNAGDTGIL